MDATQIILCDRCGLDYGNCSCTTRCDCCGEHFDSRCELCDSCDGCCKCKSRSVTPITMCIDKIRQDEDDLQEEIDAIAADEAEKIQELLTADLDSEESRRIMNQLSDEGLDELDAIMSASFDVDAEGMHSPAEFERQLGLLSDERLLEETAKFAKATLTTFEVAALVDELAHRLQRRLDLADESRDI